MRLPFPTWVTVACVAHAVSISADQDEWRVGHILVADAGSTHTQFSLYQFKTRHQGRTADELEPCCHRQLPYNCDIPHLGATGPHQLLNDTTRCLMEAASNLTQAELADTPFYLRATAGLRVLNMTAPADVNALFSAVINASFTTTMLNAGESDVASILPGADEGAFGWVAANFLEGSLRPALRAARTSRAAVRDRNTSGALDMGGASTQITFVHDHGEAAVPADTVDLYLYDRTSPIELYSHSYLCFGKDRATRRRQAKLMSSNSANCTIGPVVDPCLPVGHTAVLHPADIAAMRADVCFDGFLDEFNGGCGSGADDATFLDAAGIACSAWTGYSCDESFGSHHGYTKEAMLDIREHCPQSCLECQDQNVDRCNFVGSGDMRECNDTVLEVFRDGDGVVGGFDASVADQPSLPTSQLSPLYLFSNFFYTIQFLFLNTSTPCNQRCSRTLEQVKNRTETICSMSMADLNSTYLDLGHPAWLPGYCQAAVYELELLRRYGVTLEQENLVFAQKVNDTDVGWNLGFALNMTGDLPSITKGFASTAAPTPQVRHEDIPDEIWITLGVCVGVIGSCMIGYFYCGRRKGQNPYSIQLTRLHNTDDDDQVVLLDFNADAADRKDNGAVYEDDDELPEL